MFWFWFFIKTILLLNMDKEEPNLSTWGDISDSELVPEAAKIQKKIRKTTKKKRRFAQFARNFAGNKK